MKRVLCWLPEDAFAIINPDADALDTHVFRAVHTDFPVRIRTSSTSEVRTIAIREFLKEVLFPRDHLIVPVIGQTGTGKSHLIRWLDLQLRLSSEEREVIYVPKAQTNLRDIVLSLVSRLPPAMQEGYLTALSMTGSASLTAAAQRTAILNQLHLALVNDQGGHQSQNDPELEDYARTGLRALFSDPYIRKSLLADGGFAAEIAAHVFDKPEQYRPAEERREFREKDLPLSIGQLQEAARETQEFMRWLVGTTSADRGVVVEIVNRHLDWAIGNCLNLGGDRLIALMLDLRRHFHSQAKELVLLIEDFARLQGLDRALLQSIIEQRSDLCVLRTVFASTTGFYNSIRDTVRTRVTFLVDMDAPSESDVEPLEGFVARYMNAMRWGTTVLQEQWQNIESGNESRPVLSKCDDCAYRGDCHESFGAVDGMGLYPLTRTAIASMAVRADSNYPRTFNPREFQRHALRPVALAGNELKSGQFPPQALLSGLGGKKASPAIQSRLQREDPNQWQRRLTFLELWGQTPEVHNLDPSLHTAFDLPLLGNIGTVTSPDDKGPRKSIPSTATPEDERLKELQEWNDGRGKLSSKTCQSLRELIYPALSEFIDWDDVGLAATPFMGTKGVFKQGSISFHNQATQPSLDPLRLTIPSRWDDADARLRTALALQGLLQAKSEGTWSFSDGVEKLSCLLECLREWADVLIDQLKRSESSDSKAALAEPAFELRVIQQLILNPALSADSDQTVLKAAFGSRLSSECDFIVPELTQLLTESIAIDGTLSDLIGSRYSSTKGGQAGAFVDASRLLPLVKALRRRKFMPSESAASGEKDRRDAVDPVARLSKRWREGFSTALRREAAAREDLKMRLGSLFGERVSKEAIVQFTQRLADAAGYVSIAGNQAFLAAKARFESIDFDTFRSKLRAADPQKLDVRDLRSGVGSSAHVTTELLNSATQILDRMAAELAGRMEAVGLDPEEKARLATALVKDLDAITLQLTEYKDATAL